MACRVLFDIAGAFPELTPETVWNARSHGQTMLLWKEAQRMAGHKRAQEAIVTHAAVSAAIINTIAGKEVPEFQKMIDDLLSENGSEPPRPAKVKDDAALESIEVTRAPVVDEWSDMKEF